MFKQFSFQSMLKHQFCIWILHIFSEYVRTWICGVLHLFCGSRPSPKFLSPCPHSFIVSFSTKSDPHPHIGLCRWFEKLENSGTWRCLSVNSYPRSQNCPKCYVMYGLCRSNCNIHLHSLAGFSTAEHVLVPALTHSDFFTGCLFTYFLCRTKDFCVQEQSQCCQAAPACLLGAPHLPCCRGDTKCDKQPAWNCASKAAPRTRCSILRNLSSVTCARSTQLDATTTCPVSGKSCNPRELTFWEDGKGGVAVRQQQRRGGSSWRRVAPVDAGGEPALQLSGA